MIKKLRDLFRSSAASSSSARKQHWGRDINQIFESSKITDPFDFSGDFLISLSYPNNNLTTEVNSDTKIKRSDSATEDDFDNSDFYDNIEEPPVYVFITKTGEITSISHCLPKITSHISLDNAAINSVCNFFPSNTFLAVCNSRNSVIACSYDFDSSEDSNRFKFIEIDRIENPELICPIDNNSFIVANSKSNLYLLEISEFLKQSSSTESSENSAYKQIFSAGPNSGNPVDIAYCNGYVALSSSSGLLIGKFQEPGFVDDTIPEMQFEPFNLFFQELANVHHLTFVPMNDTVTFLFYLSAEGDAIAYLRINDNSYLSRQKGRKTKQIIISIEDKPIEIYSTSSIIKTNVISDLFCPSNSYKHANSIGQIKTVIFSCDKEIFSFTPSLTPGSSSLIFTKIKLPNQNPGSSVSNSIIKLQQTSQPDIFAALFEDGTVCICRHPPFLPADQISSTLIEIQTKILFNHHKSKPILSTTADEMSFLTFDENHVAILWESFPDWWKAPSYFRMFEDHDDTEDEEEDMD